MLWIRAQPGARRNGLAGTWNDHLKVAVTAPPDRGRANAALLEVLAEALHLRPGDLQLLSGHTSRQKRVRVPLPAARVAAILGS